MIFRQLLLKLAVLSTIDYPIALTVDIGNQRIPSVWMRATTSKALASNLS